MTDSPDFARRTLLQGAAALTLGTLVEPGRGRAQESTLLDLSAVQAVAAMTHGELSAERYAQALLARCAELRALGAFISLEPERVLEAARAADRQRATGARLGSLHGLPIPIKDSISTQDYPTTAGTPALRYFRPAHDAPLVATLRAAGAIVQGKTNLHELSYGWTSNNLAYGAVHNPYDTARIPGGSSGGTAVAIASHMAPLGVAEDTEGSIRVPAALCGVAGFRPTTGRYSTRGAVPISPLFDQIGPQARSVADLVLFDAVAAGDGGAGRGAAAPIKLAISRGYFFSDLDPEVERLTESALARLRAGGVELLEVDIGDLGPLIGLVTEQVQDHDVRIELPRFLASHGAPVDFDALIAQSSPDIRDYFTRIIAPGGPGAVSEGAYRAAVQVHLPALRARYRDYFARTGATAMVFPATLVPAPRIGEDRTLPIRGREVPFETAIARNIAPGSTVGIPGLVLPVGLTAAGLPVALEFDGPHGSDGALLQAGLALERMLGPLPPPRL